MSYYSALYRSYFDPSGNTLLFFTLAAFFIWVTRKRPLMILALICVQPYFLTAVNAQLFIQIYLSYLLLLILFYKYRHQILNLKVSSYSLPLMLFAIIILWSLVSPGLYPIRHGFFCGWSLTRLNFIHSFVPLIIIPLILKTRADIESFIKEIFLVQVVFIFIFFFAYIYLILTGVSILAIPEGPVFGVMSYFTEASLLLILLSYYFLTLPKIPIWIYASTISTLFCLVLSNSRTKFTTSIIFSTLVLLKINSSKLIKSLYFTILLSTLIIASFPEILNQLTNIIENRVEQTTNATDLRELTSGRDWLYKQAILSWQTSPYIGVGEGYAIPPTLHYGKRIRQATHNYYLGVLAQQGIIGFSLLLMALFLVFNHMVKLHNMLITLNKPTILFRLLIVLVGYGLACMVFKAHWGTTFWSIAVFETYYRICRKYHTKRRKSLLIKYY